MLQVVAALIERAGRTLICRRQKDQSHALKWEFPGGKVEAGETPAQALARELEEELGIRDAAGEEIDRYEFCYPGKNPILLIFFRVTAFTGEPANLIFSEMRWEPPASLASFDFVEGDLRFLESYTGSYAPSDQTGRTRPE
ncbi:MAG TPA: (deoxy)nucleoside triphosphate pyrophosphohydrolase [Candidatus Sulfopaludibacter sp.]|nr:(deoxy)nucleoside triphosphate pyrophosphohydrolase [Candidatus Sulfopaludibacter sp.]